MLDEARDNAGFATPDEYLGLAEPDGVRRARPRPVPPVAWLEFPTGKKVDLALELERAVQAADPRITGVESAEFVDAMGEGCVVTTTGIRRPSRVDRLLRRHVLPRHRGRRDPDRVRVLGRARAVRPRPDRSRPPTPPAGPPACSAPPSRRAPRVTVVLDPYVTAQLLGILGGDPVR